MVLTSKLSSKFSLAYNGTLNRTRKFIDSKSYDNYKSWWGSALYLNFDPAQHLGFTLRGEYFSDKNQMKVYSTYLTGGDVFATTLSANIKVDNFIFIPEIRIDKASQPIFIKKDGTATKKAANVLFAAIYSF
jgi:hypothetical protein